MADKKISIFVEAAVAGAKRKLKELEDGLGRLGKTTSTTATSVSGDMGRMEQAATVLEGAFKKLAILAAGYLTKMAAQGIVELSVMAAKNLELEESYERVAARYGMASDSILAALDRAARGTVDKFSLMIGANKALRLGVAATVGELEQLMKIAVVRAREFSISTQQAWDAIINAVGRASPAYAAHLGILQDADTIYREYAESIGKAASDLTMLEQRQALFNNVLVEGADDIEHWAEMGDSAAAKFERLDASIVNLKQSVGELTVGPMADLADKLSTLPDILDKIGYLSGLTFAGIGASFAKLSQLIEQRDWAAILEGQTVRAGEAAMRMYARQDAASKGWITSFNDLDIKLRDTGGLVRDFGAATEDTARDQEELDAALQKGADTWADYGRQVEEANYQFARKVEDAQFRATQAIEDAAFRRYEIERNAGDRRGDILAQYDIRLEAATATHYNRLRYMRQDLLDELSDMDWEHEQDRADMMKRAPWWIRQALQKEFSERERIAKTGDSKALRDYDKALKERIRAIDPIYAQELDLLDEHYEHQADVEKREAGQGQQRQKDDWDIRNREQRRSLDEQDRQLLRGLDNQLGAWYFHEGQREEAERRSMGRMHDEHDHALAAMYENTIRRLEAITPIWEAYGYEWGMALLKGMANATPWTAVEPGYTPDFTNPFGPGGTYGAAPRAAVASGAMTTNNVTVNVGGGWTPYQGQEVATQVATKLGQMTVRQTR